MKNKKEKIYSILDTLFSSYLLIPYILRLYEQIQCFFYKNLLVGIRISAKIEKGANI